MGWIEASSGVKFLCWGKPKEPKEGQTKDDFIVVKQGESITGIIERIKPQTEKDETVAYQYFLRTKELDESVIVWSNASIFRQHEQLDLVEGDEVRFTYMKDYPGQGGKVGRDIKVEVNR